MKGSKMPNKELENKYNFSKKMKRNIRELFNRDSLIRKICEIRFKNSIKRDSALYAICDLDKLFGSDLAGLICELSEIDILENLLFDMFTSPVRLNNDYDGFRERCDDIWDTHIGGAEEKDMDIILDSFINAMEEEINKMISQEYSSIQKPIKD